MRKMDEMELQHNLFAIKSAYAFTLMFETFYLIYIGINQGFTAVTDNIVFFLVLSQSIVYFLSHLLLRNKVGDESAGISIGISVGFVAIFIIIGLILINKNPSI